MLFATEKLLWWLYLQLYYLLIKKSELSVLLISINAKYRVNRDNYNSFIDVSEKDIPLHTYPWHTKRANRADYIIKLSLLSWEKIFSVCCLYLSMYLVSAALKYSQKTRHTWVNITWNTNYEIKILRAVITVNNKAFQKKKSLWRCIEALFKEIKKKISWQPWWC